MSEPKNFLSRWSERKLRPEGEKSAPGQKESAPQTVRKADVPSRAPEAEFDISTLPSLESITANSDIRAFLQRGVPAELTRAALRRAWSADPAIRDFVGLSENSWDFNTPDSIPGFGSFAPEELKQAVAQFFGGLTEKGEERIPAGNTGESEKISSKNNEEKSDSKASSSAVTTSEQVDVASQQNEEEAPITFARQTRRHGGALPE